MRAIGRKLLVLLGIGGAVAAAGCWPRAPEAGIGVPSPLAVGADARVTVDGCGWWMELDRGRCLEDDVSLRSLTSSDPSVVAAGPGPEIHGVGPGTATVRAKLTVGGVEKRDSARVEVRPVDHVELYVCGTNDRIAADAEFLGVPQFSAVGGAIYGTLAADAIFTSDVASLVPLQDVDLHPATVVYTRFRAGTVTSAGTITSPLDASFSHPITVIAPGAIDGLRVNGPGALSRGQSNSLRVDSLVAGEPLCADGFERDFTSLTPDVCAVEASARGINGIGNDATAALTAKASGTCTVEASIPALTLSTSWSVTIP